MIAQDHLGRPSECPVCQERMERLCRHRLLKTHRRVKVQTWCRLCGEAEILDVVLQYEYAVRHFYALDDQPMSHRGHEETGGWGVHWRLDDVLRIVFPGRHKEDLWPKPVWYPRAIGETWNINTVTDDEIKIYQPETIDPYKVAMRDILDGCHMTRVDLELGGQVWDQDELDRDFEVLGWREPFLLVQRRADGARGSLMTQQRPLYYFAFETGRVV